MLLKKFSYLLLAGCISTFAMSCDDEDDTIPEIVDTTDPVGSLTSPTSDQITAGFAPGDVITVTGTVTDDRDLESVTLSFAAPDEDPAGWLKTWEEAQITDNTLEINESITIPADAEDGTYVLTLRAHDDADNIFSQSWNITVASAATEENVTFNVTVPAGTPEGAQIFLVGQMTGWAADEDGMWELTDNGDGTYSGTFAVTEESLAEGQGYKFRIKSDDAADAWKFVEKDAECAEIDDRQYEFMTEMQTIDVTVENWRNVEPCGN